MKTNWYIRETGSGSRIIKEDARLRREFQEGSGNDVRGPYSTQLEARCMAREWRKYRAEREAARPSQPQKPTPTIYERVLVEANQLGIDPNQFIKNVLEEYFEEKRGK